MQVVEEEDALHAEGEGTRHVIEGKGERGAAVHEEIHHTVEAEEEIHRHVLSVAEVYELAMFEGSDEFS